MVENMLDGLVGTRNIIFDVSDETGGRSYVSRHGPLPQLLHIIHVINPLA
jgi:hypothetical protein